MALAIAWPTTFLPSIAIGAALFALLPNTTAPQFGDVGWIMLVGLVIFAPFSETLIMAGVLSLLLKAVSPTLAVVLSAVAWGIAHSLAAPTWGLVIWWPFLIFSTLYVTWLQHSLWAALAMPAAAHALHNLVPALLLMWPPATA